MRGRKEMDALTPHDGSAQGKGALHSWKRSLHQCHGSIDTQTAEV